ncbi:MAG TPA: hypothetical protein VM554_10430 [Acidisarcina sp.]|nr:hypothetical protein [Acidisarcina sp.]
MTFVKRLPGVVAWLGILLAFLPQRALAVATDTVQGTVYRADGSVAQGTLLLSWPAFTTSANEAVASGSKSIPIGADGWVAIGLAPNAGAAPDGTYYTAVYHLNDGTTSTEYWVVPSAATVSLASVRAKVMPVAMAVQAVTKQYVDTSIAGVTTGFVPSSGGTMTGPLLLNSDPITVQQAASKHYVDQAASALLPMTGGTMKGSLTLANDPVGNYDAATKEYVDRASSASVSKAGDTMTGPLTTPVVNGKYFPEGTTLQQAINAAGATGAVEIPANYAGTDTFTNPYGIPVIDLRVMEYRSVTDWGVKCDFNGSTGTDNYQALHDAFVAAINPYKPFGLKFPAGKCYTSKPLPYTCQYLKGVGTGLSVLVGGPGQDIISNMDPNDRTTDGLPGGGGNGICGWQGIVTKGKIQDLTLQVDTSVDVTQLYTTLTNAIGATDTSLTVGSTQYYRRAGFVLVDQELIHYTTVSGNTITTSNAVDRGYGGTVAVAHAAGAPVHYLGDLSFSGQGSAWANKPWVSSISHAPASTLRTWPTANIGATDTSITLASIAGLPTSGVIQLGGEFVSYTGISGNTLTGLTRGLYATTAVAHNGIGGNSAGETVVYSSYLPGVLGATAAAGSTSITLAYAPIGFPASGTLLIDSERINYSAISGNTITTTATAQAHDPGAVVNVVDGIAASQTTIAITDNPANTPLGYADFGGYGEVIGAIGIDYGTASNEYATYTDGIPFIIPGTTPTKYFLVYLGVKRGQTSTTAVAHASNAVINAVNPFTFTTPTQNGKHNGVIPAWNIGNCGLAFHYSDGSPAGALVTNPTLGNPDLENIEFLGSSSNSTSSCSIFYQSWPYSVSVKNYHIWHTNYGIVWAMAGVNDAAQAYNGAAGWTNTSPYNKFTNGMVDTPVPWFSIAGPQIIDEMNIESGPNTINNVDQPFSESRQPSDGLVTDEAGYVTGSDLKLKGVSGEFNLGTGWHINPFYPAGILHNGMTSNAETILGPSWFTQQPFYLDTSTADSKGQFLGNVILTDSSFANNLATAPAADYGKDNTVTGIATANAGYRKLNGIAQIENVGQSRPDAFLMGNINNDWFNSLVDMKIEPEDLMSTLGSPRGVNGSIYSDATVPLGRGKALHIPYHGQCCGWQGGGWLQDSGVPLNQRINYGKGTMYLTLKADYGPTTQGWSLNLGTTTTCNLTPSWSVCAVPYDTTINGRGWFNTNGGVNISSQGTANGSGISLGPIVFSPKWDSINVTTANVDNVVAKTVSTSSQVGTSVASTINTNLGSTSLSTDGIPLTSTCNPNSVPVNYTQPAFGVPGQAVIDSEVISWGSVHCRGDYSVSLDNLSRGLLGTTATTHSFGAAISTIPYSLLINNALQELCTSTGCNFGPGSPTYPLSFGGVYGGDLSGNWHTNTLISNVATGTAPISVTSTTPVANLTLASPSQVSGLFAEADISYSATPTFSSTGSVNYLLLTGNVTSSTIGAGASGQSMTFVVCQDSVGGHTFAWPANVRGGMTIGATASTCSSQSFSYVSALSKWVAGNAGVANE